MPISGVPDYTATSPLARSSMISAARTLGCGGEHDAMYGGRRRHRSLVVGPGFLRNRERRCQIAPVVGAPPLLVAHHIAHTDTPVVALPM